MLVASCRVLKQDRPNLSCHIHFDEVPISQCAKIKSIPLDLSRALCIEAFESGLQSRNCSMDADKLSV